ncbi:hypothetical protein ES695_01245 [Candidatus Atribacteria bacterium 1244-E10-H5-B2]|nr:MAG: hypothetical protein ES695_01245 [Candidatus Atribacteria bacterium 1244-E10-H5-B2]
MLNKRILTLVSLLLISFLLAGCWIVAINRAPEITPIPDQTATLDVLFTYDVEATDPDTGDVLVYSLDGEPDGMIIDPDSGVITWTPTAEGSVVFTVVVTDEGGLFDDQEVTIVVSAVPSDDATLKSLTVTVGTLVPEFASDTYNYTVELPYGASEFPEIVATPTDPKAGVSIFGLSGETPPGKVNIRVTAEDGTEQFYYVTFTVAAPVGMEINVDLPEFIVDQEEAITVNIVANDDVGKKVRVHFILPEGDYQIVCEGLWGITNLLPGTSYISGPPEGYSLKDKTINFRATFKSVGTYEIPIEVREVGTNALLCSKDIEIEVNPILLTSIVVDPKIMALAYSGPGQYHWEEILSVDAYYNDGTKVKIVYPFGDCDFVSDNTAVAEVVDYPGLMVVLGGGTEGTATITVSYTEGDITKTDEIEVTVNANN